jgi:hypothetical protein
MGVVEGDPALQLYRRALAQHWNPDTDIDWTQSDGVELAVAPARAQVLNELYWTERETWWTVKRMNTPIQRYFADHHFSLCAAAHTFDEARHVYVLERYCKQIGALGECPTFWKVIPTISMAGSSVVNYFYTALLSETLGEVVFALLRRSNVDPLLKSICEKALRDEARHIMYFTEGVRRIHRRISAARRVAMRQILRMVIFMTLCSIRRLEKDAQTIGIDRDEFLECLERKVVWSIRRAGVESVVSPRTVHRLAARFRTNHEVEIDATVVTGLAALEEDDD